MQGGTPIICRRIKEYGIAYLDDDPDGLHIKVRKYDDGLLVLNYCQINSPKMDPSIQECRGLIVSTDGRVVSRSFDRFFNIGEASNERFSLHCGDVITEKLDGSLIKLYYWEGEWRISTRGTAFAEAPAGDGRTFADICRDAAPQLFSPGVTSLLNTQDTHIFELTTPENRVVKHYQEPAAVYLATRNNATGMYENHSELWGTLGIRSPRVFQFGTAHECVESAKSLPDLDEGYVVYRNGAPICKIKSPAYVAAHRLFSGPMTTKRSVELLLSGEADEMIAYFPEFAETLSAHRQKIDAALVDMDMRFLGEWDTGDVSQKEFALRVAGFPYSAILFQARQRGLMPSEAFYAAKESLRIQIAMGAIGE